MSREMRLEIKCGLDAAEVAIELLNEEGEGDGDTGADSDLPSGGLDDKTWPASVSFGESDSSEGTTIRVCPTCGTPLEESDG